MLEKMKLQKIRWEDYTEMRKVRGELLINIRAALQNMADMLIIVEDQENVKKGSEETETADQFKAIEEEKPIIELQEAETDGQLEN